MARDGHGGEHASGMGFEKEPKQPHGPKVGGRHPLVHSHGMKPHRKIRTKGGRK
jgi:hypothetical protein